jgi:hypothetical protein
MGGPAENNKIYKTVVVMLVESCALYAVTFLLFFVPWVIESPVTNAFFGLLANMQVRNVAAFSAQPQDW